jgi:glycine/D-amino acid oxidase-like deaminating enzyme
VGDRLETIGEDGTVAQVDPLRLSRWLLESSKANGVALNHPARAMKIVTDAQGEMTGLQIKNEMTEETDTVACDRLVVTAGAWSPAVFEQLFPRATRQIPVSSLAGHSLVVRSPRWSAEREKSGCHAVFSTEIGGFSPEIFSRIGGEIYVAGLNSSSLPLPKTGADAKVDPSAIQKLKVVCRRTLGLPEGQEDDLEVLREGLCFRPVTDRGTPIVSKVHDELLGDIKTKKERKGGVFLSAGHGPWGISMSVGTGKVLSELIDDVDPSADVRSLKL